MTVFPRKPRHFLLPAVFLAQFFFPTFLFSQRSRSSDAYIFALETEMKAMIRDVIFTMKPPSRANIGLFERIFLQEHHSPNTELLATEFLFAAGDEVPPSYIVQTAQNLEEMKMFRQIRFTFDTTKAKRIDVRIHLEERPNIAPFLITELGGGTASFGLGADISHAGSSNTHLRARTEYRTVNAIGIEAALDLDVRRVLDWFNLRFHLLGNRFRNEQELELSLPYSADSPYFEASLVYSRGEGQEFWYKPLERSSLLTSTMLEAAPFDLKRFESNRVSLFGAVRGWHWDNEFFLMGRLSADATMRTRSEAQRVGDNSFVFHAGGAWERRKIDVSAEQEDWLQFGTPAKGTYVHAWLGGISSPAVSIIPRGGGGTWLLRGGIQGFLTNRVYASMGGEASGFSWNKFIDFFGTHYLFGKTALHLLLTKEMLLSARLFTEGAAPTLRPRNGAGREGFVQGFGANTLIGSTRMLLQLELRGLEIANVGIFRLQGAIFGEAATVGIEHTKNDYSTQLLLSCGAGLRLHYPSFSGAGQGTLRLDLAYLPTLGRFGQIILSTQEAFTIFEDFPAKQARLLNDQRWVE